MQIQSKIIDYNDFSHILAKAKYAFNPSEVHGMLCGLVCVEQKFDAKFWVNMVFKLLESRELFGVPRETLVSLYDTIYHQLHAAAPLFQIVLPNELESFDSRALSLSTWCRGFMYGLNLDEKPIMGSLSEDAQDALQCLEQIGQLNFEEIEVSENDKLAYDLVVEFVRSAVMIIYQDCSHKDDAASVDAKKPLAVLH